MKHNFTFQTITYKVGKSMGMHGNADGETLTNTLKETTGNGIVSTVPPPAWEDCKRKKRRDEICDLKSEELNGQIIPHFVPYGP